MRTTDFGPGPSAPLPPGVDEVVFAGWLRGQGVDLVRCVTNDLEVPAQAEIVIEGQILAGEHEDEGPYGEYTGYSTFRSTRNIFLVKAITHRAHPIFHDIIPGYSMEHLLLGREVQRQHVKCSELRSEALGRRNRHFLACSGKEVGVGFP